MFFNYISILFLFISGISITIAAGFFSISGFVLLIPDESIFIGIIILAISFEIAKIASSTFLFHQMKNNEYPMIFKIFLMISIVLLMVVSAISTYSHLNYTISENIDKVNVYSQQLSDLQIEKTQINVRIKQIDDAVQSVNSEKSVKNKLILKKSYDDEKNNLIKKEEEINNKINEVTKLMKSDDKFIFLNSLSKLFGLDKETIFTLIILTIVFIVDPLAITLIIAATFLLSSTLRQAAKEKKDKDNVVHHIHETTIDNRNGIIEVHEKIIDEYDGSKKEETVEEIITKIVKDDPLPKDNIEFNSTLSIHNTNVSNDKIEPLDINTILGIKTK